MLDPLDHLEHQDCPERLAFLVKPDPRDQLVCQAKMD